MPNKLVVGCVLAGLLSVLLALLPKSDGVDPVELEPNEKKFEVPVVDCWVDELVVPLLLVAPNNEPVVDEAAGCDEGIGTVSLGVANDEKGVMDLLSLAAVLFCPADPKKLVNGFTWLLVGRDNGAEESSLNGVAAKLIDGVVVLD